MGMSTGDGDGELERDGDGGMVAGGIWRMSDGS
jgi:hypothetical protein